MTDPTAAVDDYPMATRTATRAPTVNADADRMRPLPDGWRWVRLRDICHKITDGTHQPPPFTLTGIPFLFVRNIVSGRIDFNVEKYVSQATYEELTLRCRPNRGDVLYSAVGSFGVAVVIETDEPFTFQRHIAHLKLRPDVADPHFLAYYINSPGGKRQSEDAALGGAQRTVALASLANFLIPLPPLRDQRRIAAILRERMAAVERARAAAEAQLEAARALTAAYLRAVFESDEAREWPRARLGDVVTLVQNGVYKPQEFYGRGYPFLRMYNIPNDSWHLDVDKLARVTLTDGEFAAFRVEQGDLLISRVNSFELVGKCALVGPEATGYVFENMLIRIRPTRLVAPLFIAQQFSTMAIRDQVGNVAKRAIGQSSINSEDVRRLEIALPELKEQQRLASKVDEQVEGARRLQARLEAQLDAIETLPAALLRQAFNGEL